MPPYTDPARYLGAVTRTVAHRDRDGRPVRAVIAARTYDTTVDDLWDAITSAERLPRWFLPVTGDLRLGGRFQLTGNAGGEILACEPPRHLAVTWEFGGKVNWVDVRLAPDGVDGASARLELEHVAPADEFWDQYGPGAVGVGWDMALFYGLVTHIASGAAVDPKDAEAWFASEAGRAFVRGSSDDWARAHAAGGADPEAARGAGERTTAAYTGS
jgi:uncharacterized protein YndB with AHSA1/START domain